MGGIVAIIKDRTMPSALHPGRPVPTSPTTDLAAYERQAVARHLVFELRTPLLSLALMYGACAWLMHGRVPHAWVAAWLAFGVAASVTRECFVWWIRPRMDSSPSHTTVLGVYPWLSLASGIAWGAFCLMYANSSEPLTQLLAGTATAALIGVAVISLSVHLPALYAFALPIFSANLWLYLRSGESEQLALAGLSLVYLSVIVRYAHDARRVHRETIRLRFENQRLISDLEQRNAEVENASRNKSLFLAGVSHDLKQPIRAIGMYTGFLRHSAPRDAASDVVTQTAEKIESAVSAIHGQISRLLELSRLESGAMPLNLELLDLDDVFSSVHQLLAPQAQAQDVRLRWAFGRQREVWADRRMLESILANFISNAIKHTEGGRVYVGMRWRTGYPEGQRLCIEVRDSGSGITPEQLPLLFDAYRSFDDRQASESHGLGLAIAKAQASYLGCDIAVNSAPGRGSTFTLCGLRSAKPAIGTMPLPHTR
jgi:signal transduction histidine kinase